MSLLENLIGFCTVELESTYGTDPASSPVGLNLREWPDVTVDRQQIERTRVKPTVGGEPHVNVGNKNTFSFQTTLAPIKFADGQTPATSPILKSAGMGEESTGSTSSNDVVAKYTPQARAHDSFTLKLYIADKDSPTDYSKVTITGCRCNLTLTYGIADEILIDVEGEGLYAEWTSLQDLTGEEPSTFHEGVTPFTSPNQSFSYGSVGTITNWEFATGHTINNVQQATAAETVKEVFLTKDSRHSGSFDPLATSVGASDDPKDIVRNDKELSMSLGVTTPNGNGTFDFSAPKAQLTEAPMESGDGHMRFGSSYMLNEDAGDDDFELKWKTTDTL